MKYLFDFMKDFKIYIVYILSKKTTKFNECKKQSLNQEEIFDPSVNTNNDNSEVLIQKTPLIDPTHRSYNFFFCYSINTDGCYWRFSFRI